VLDAVDGEPTAVTAVGREPSERDLRDRHAQRLEVALQQLLALVRREMREAQLEIAPRDVPLSSRERVHRAAVGAVYR
jgi:hypothetical protein